MKKLQEPTVRKTQTVEPTVSKSLTVATSTRRIHWQLLVAAIVLLSVVVLSGQELRHVPPAAPTYSVLHYFAGPPTDGALPQAGLIRDVAGNLYGTTTLGGATSTCDPPYGCGVVFKLSPSGTETVLHSFTGGADGAYPYYAGLVQDAAGNLYGTAREGGATSTCDPPYGCGVVFKLTPSGTETVLYSFTGGADGGYPFAALIRDSSGNLYGTTSAGGRVNRLCLRGTCGVVFKLSATGTETILHSFTRGFDGAEPYAGLTQDAAGNLYGTTSDGGASGLGVVFELVRCSSVAAGYEFKVLHTFTGVVDGAFPIGGLVRDASGGLYGTTSGGGESSACGTLSETCGVVFRLSPTGTETVLHNFAGVDGGKPWAGLIQDAAGNLYGTTLVGGPGSSSCGFGTCGVVFKLTP
jgi:uncharacterized repeat protein (TIGR03803 family)